MEEKSPTSFPIGQAAVYADIGLPMIDYLCRIGIVVPSGARSHGRGRGKSRHFTFADVVTLRMIGKLLKQGIGVTRLKSDLRKANQRYAQFGGGTAPMRYLCTDGARAYFRNGDQALEELRTGQLSFSFIMDFEQIKGEVVDLMRANPSPKKWRRPRRALRS